MAMPKEYRTAKVIEVEAALAKMTSEQKAALPSLVGGDYRLIGKIVQNFCFVDLHLRRALAVFHEAKLIPEPHAKGYPDYQDTNLTTVLADTLKALKPPPADLETVLTFLEAILKMRGYRNLVSHTAGKRFPNADVLVFAGKNERDAQKAMGHGLDGHRIQFSVLGRSELEDMLTGLASAENYFGVKKIPQWTKDYLKPLQANVAV